MRCLGLAQMVLIVPFSMAVGDWQGWKGFLRPVSSVSSSSLLYFNYFNSPPPNNISTVFKSQIVLKINKSHLSFDPSLPPESLSPKAITLNNLWYFLHICQYYLYITISQLINSRPCLLTSYNGRGKFSRLTSVPSTFPFLCSHRRYRTMSVKSVFSIYVRILHIGTT